MRREDLEPIAALLRDKDIIVLSDEIYAELTYGGERHVSIASLPGMKERTVVVNGFSKAYAMTGWRLGYACGPEPIIKVMTKIHQSAIMCAPTTSQYAAVTALRRCDADIEAMRSEYDMRRRFLVSSLNRMGLDCFEPEGVLCLPFPFGKRAFQRGILRKAAVRQKGSRGAGQRLRRFRRRACAHQLFVFHRPFVRGAAPHRAVFRGAGRVSDGKEVHCFRSGLCVRSAGRGRGKFRPKSAAARALGPSARACEAEPGGETRARAVTTHPAVLDAVCAALRRRGVESITVADSPGGLYNPAVMKSIYKASGLLAVCERHGALAYTARQRREKTDGVRVKEFSLLRPPFWRRTSSSTCRRSRPT